MAEPRAFTKEEIRDEYLTHFAQLAKYWATVEGVHAPKTTLDRLNGLVFSILTTIDGSSAMLPALSISVDPHPEDKDYHISQGENYYEQGMTINDDVALHEIWNKYQINEEPQTT